MRLLLLTFYYPPDLSAGSYRAAALIRALRNVGAPDLEIDVITTMPNRYASYRGAMLVSAGESVDADLGVAIKRIEVPRHRSGLADQCVSFAGFAAGIVRATRGERYDIVVATSSRLFTAFLGALIAQRTGALLYLDIRDLFIDTVQDLFRGHHALRALSPLLSRVERYAFRRASRVNLVSGAFLSHCARLYPQQTFRNFSNGIDSEFLEFDFATPLPNTPKVILYAGNIGLGQALAEIIPEAARRLGKGFEFRIIGDGSQRSMLEQRVRSCGVGNVSLLAPVDRETLKHHYRDADYLMLHLNDHPALEKVLPSKLFEYGATGKPILAGVRGHAREFIEAHLENAAVFDPGDAQGLVDALGSLAPVHLGRTDFKHRFARVRIMNAMAADVLDTGQHG